MEHDGSCERVGTARGVARKIQLTRPEFDALTAETMIWGIACACDGRSGVKFPEPVSGRQLRDQTTELVLRARKARHGMGFVGELSRQALQVMNDSTTSRGARVISVDFKNRRRID